MSILEDFPKADLSLPPALVVAAYNDLRQRAHVLEMALAMTTDPDDDLDEPLGRIFNDAAESGGFRLGGKW